MPEPTRKLVGLAGMYDDPDALVRAAEQVRDAGWRKWDCHSPYPVHGLDAAMGLGPSPIPLVCLGVGFGGAVVAMLMQWWMSVIDYPVRIGGKPLFSWQAFVPITFELFVLHAALGTFVAMIIFCKLGRWYSPLYDAGIMAEVTTSRFAVILDARDSRFDEVKSRSLLEATGCEDIRPVFELEEEGQ
ncbi:MAG: DUF3341 domain-containing protein [Planctomycetota bacterium]|jgi:hypothetical protein